MDVLLICGTGAIGNALTKELVDKGYSVYVTTRRNLRSNCSNVHYLCGDSKDSAFMGVVLARKNWDSIVDFGHYDVDDMQRWMPIFLMATKHYIFVSSSRVYGPYSDRITESTPRQVDLQDFSIPKYGAAFVKAFGENLLKDSWQDNWTIVRPYITYNTSRLQLGIYEIEWWLQRLLSGSPIIIPRKILPCRTTLTYAGDTAKRIAGIVGKDDAKGELYQIASNEHHTWQEVLDVYLEILADNGFVPSVYITDDDAYVDCFFDRDQYEHDRLYNRVFDSAKIDSVTGCQKYTALKDGLSMCFEQFVNEGGHFPRRENYRQWEIYINQRVSWKECSSYKKGECLPVLESDLPKRKIICFGAGSRLKASVDYLKTLYDIQFVVDNDHSKWGQNIAGLPIKSPTALVGYENTLCVLTVDNVKEAFLMMGQAMNYGINKVEHLKNMMK